MRERISDLIYIHKHVRSIEKRFFADLKADGYILDAGCGNRTFIKPRNNIIGVDIKKVKAGGFVMGDLRNLPFKDGAFSLIICNSVLEHIRECDQVLSEFRRMGKALLVTVSTNNVREPFACIANTILRIKSFKSSQCWIRMVENSGFEILERKTYFKRVEVEVYAICLIMFPLLFLSKYIIRAFQNHPSSDSLIFLSCKKSG